MEAHGTSARPGAPRRARPFPGKGRRPAYHLPALLFAIAACLAYGLWPVRTAFQPQPTPIALESHD